jgi:hypothetical protein
VTALAFNPTNANVLYVTLSGFDEGTPGQPGHVFKTTNALAASPTWVNVSPPVNIPHNTIVLDPSDPNIVYVGTDLGVWNSANGGSTWTHMGPEIGLPNVAVFELQIDDTTNRLVAFTHGRSALAFEISDTTPPSCVLTAVIPGPPKQLQITAQDTGSGLKQINVLEATNSTVDVPSFTAGTTNPVVVTATKIDQSQASRVTLQIIDVANNTTTCDPVMTEVIRDPGQPVSQTLTGIPEKESLITIHNDAPGLTNLSIDVNGDHFEVAGLRDNEVRNVDVSDAMLPGDQNTIILTAKGKPGGQATILISE